MSIKIRDNSFNIELKQLSWLLLILVGIVGCILLEPSWANEATTTVATKFMLSIVDTSAAWIYLNQGAVIAMITVPSIIGIMLGSMVGVALLKKVNASVVRKVVIIMLLLAGSRALLKGFGI